MCLLGHAVHVRPHSANAVHLLSPLFSVYFGLAFLLRPAKWRVDRTGGDDEPGSLEDSKRHTEKAYRSGARNGVRSSSLGSRFHPGHRR